MCENKLLTIKIRTFQSAKFWEKLIPKNCKPAAKRNRYCQITEYQLNFFRAYL